MKQWFIHAGEAYSLPSISAKAILSPRVPTGGPAEIEKPVVFIGGSFPTYLLWIRRPSGLRGRPPNETYEETYDARLSLDVERRIADNFVYSPGLGKHRHMA